MLIMTETRKCSLFDSNACSHEENFKNITMFSEREIFLLQRRSGISDLEFVCSNHEKVWLVFYTVKQLYCCDPLQKHKKKIKKSLFTITHEFEIIYKGLNQNILEGNKLCTDCRIEISKQVILDTPFTDFSDNSGILLSQTSLSIESDQYFTPPELTLEKINESLKSLNIQSVNVKQLRSTTFKTCILNDITAAYKLAFDKITDKFNEQLEEISQEIDSRDDGKQIISQLKDKFRSTQSRDDKVLILSVLPQNWSTTKIQKEFGASKHIVTKMKQLVKEQGILCKPKPKTGRILPQATVDEVVSFYLNSDVSREMPGKKDYVSVVKNGKREHKQKRLVLGNLKEIYQHFRKKFPNTKVKFSKFAEFRPKECILAGACGTHTVCVCTTHENFKLMISVAKLSSLEHEAKQLSSYKEYLQYIKCDSPTEKCHLLNCKDCPNIEKLRNALLNYFEENMVDNISYQQWIQVDRCSLETIMQSMDDFVDALIEKLKKLSPHDYVAKKQSHYFQLIRESIQVGEVLVIADFSENYAFVVQNSVQGMHWNNAQATVHPFSCYFRPNVDEDVQPLSFVVISDDLNHNTSSVHYFQMLLIQFLKTKIPSLSKIIYMSDGAASQYKNRYNILNVCLHERDFAVPAEWHFFEIAHGKGPSDGLGGSLKRLAARASLQLPYDKQIQTPRQLFDWAKENISGITFSYASKDETDVHSKMLDKRFCYALPITGIRSHHVCIPHSDGSASMKLHSFSEDEIIYSVLKYHDENIHDNSTTSDNPRVTRSAKNRKSVH